MTFRLRTLGYSPMLAMALLLVAATSGTVQAAEPTQTLSVFAPGTMPNSPPVHQALQDLAETGTKPDIQLLEHIVRTERPELAAIAQHAIRVIRMRHRSEQRRRFSDRIQSTDISRQSALFRQQGQGPTTAWCAAYATAVLGVSKSEGVEPENIFSKRARLESPTLAHAPASVRIAAYEDAGEVRLVIRTLTEQAAGGDDSAVRLLSTYGVDVERLLLGVRQLDRRLENSATEHLIQEGQSLTVHAFAEEALYGQTPSQKAVAVDALGRMLHSERAEQLPANDQAQIRSALRQASKATHPELRSIGLDALNGNITP